MVSLGTKYHPHASAPHRLPAEIASAAFGSLAMKKEAAE